MAKRFIETTMWTGNKWFRKLEPKYKLLWFYLISNCDAVGVWEEDLELASFIICFEFNHDDILEIFNSKLKIINDGKKWWITDFCNFQYGELKEENINNKPHQSYIKLLKKHRLWIDYKKTLQGLKEKEKDKELDKEKEYWKLTEIFWNDLKALVNPSRYNINNPDLEHWSQHIRLLHERDGVEYKDMREIWRWAMEHNFWKAQILSTANFRNHFDKLKIQRDSSLPSKPKTSADYKIGDK